MKKLILGAALASLLAAPALAQSYDPDYGTGNTIQVLPPLQAQTDSGPLAFAPSTMNRLRGVRAEALPSASPAPVYAYGHYVGTDPYPSIRFQLHRDPPGLD